MGRDAEEQTAPPRQQSLFGLSGNLWFDSYDEKYRFFHMFAPVRVFEYIFGMVIFRLYKEGFFEFLKKDYVSGIVQALLLAALYGSLFLMSPSFNPGVNYFIHHSVAVFIYGLFVLSLLYHVCANETCRHKVKVETQEEN